MSVARSGQFDPMDQNADGTSDENALTTPFFGTTPGDVYAVPTPNCRRTVRSRTDHWFGAQSILQPTFGFNTNTLPIIVPGPQVLTTRCRAVTAHGNLITDGTTSTLNVTFDRPMQVNTARPASRRHPVPSPG